SHYTKSKLPGVGISIGLTRLFWQLREAGLVAAGESTVDVLVTQMDAGALPQSLALASELRAGGSDTEVVMEASRLGKQFKYADRAGIRFVAVLGEDEAARGGVTIKGLRDGAQPEAPPAGLLAAPPASMREGAAEFLASQVAREEPIYGVSTGFGSNADRLLGARRTRSGAGDDARNPHESLHAELQHNLIVTHAVCVGEPFAPEVVRAMLCIRINTLLRGHSGIRVETLQALVAMLNAGIVPVVPQLGSVGASGDLAPLSHLAIVLLGGGEAFYQGERIPGGEALARAGLEPVSLSYKEGL